MTGAPSESPFANRTVIVLGPVRSGTTWLVELLLAHPALAGLSWESTIFMALWDLWENAHRADGEGISAYLGPDEVAAALRGFCDRTFSVADGEWFVEKTPDNVNRIPLISAAYPDAWYVHLIRDGREVAASLAERFTPPQRLAHGDTLRLFRRPAGRSGEMPTAESALAGL